jgi:hypothetical protein
MGGPPAWRFGGGLRTALHKGSSMLQNFVGKTEGRKPTGRRSIVGSIILEWI